MRKTYYLLFFLYFMVLAGGSTFYYLKYILNNSFSGIQTIETEVINSNALIIYSKGNILTLFDSTKPDDVKTLESQSQLGKFDLNKIKSQFIFEVKNNNQWEIRQGDFDKLERQKIAYQGQTQLIGFTSFINPKFSPDKSKFSFVGEGENGDTLFIKEMGDDSIQKITLSAALKISDYSWSQDSNKLVYCTTNLFPNACFKFDLITMENTKLFEKEIKLISWSNTDDIIYLSRSETPHLYSTDENGHSNQIDDVSAPKNIVSFQLDREGRKIIYDIISEQKSDVYFSNLDGSNRLQLTTDGNSSQPTFSPSGQIAYLRQKDGIYTIDSDKTNELKLISLTDTIDSLLFWR